MPMKRMLFFCLTAFSLTTTYAMPQIQTPNDPGVFLGADAGMLFTQVMGSNSIGTGAGWPPDYYSTQSITNQPGFFFDSGYTWAHSADWFPYYTAMLQYFYLPITTVKGSIDQYSLPNFRNYNYQYDISLLNIMGLIKVDIYRWNNFLPFILAGAGVVNYDVSNYKENPTSGVTPRVNPLFSGNNGNNFSYELGIGFDYILQKNLWLNIQYTYFNFGTIQAGPGTNYSTLTGTNYDNESLKNKISAKGIFAGATYYID